MSAKYPVLPIAGGTVLRAFAVLLAFVTYWFKRMARARRHRRDAAMLAGFDQHMLTDIGLRTSDINDAFSMPFWKDPTPLLRQRVQERRLYRHVDPPIMQRREMEPRIHRLKIDRVARRPSIV